MKRIGEDERIEEKVLIEIPSQNLKNKRREEKRLGE